MTAAPADPPARLTHPDGSPIRALVVDDEVALGDLLQMALRYEGWDVRTATTGQEALRAPGLSTERTDEEGSVGRLEHAEDPSADLFQCAGSRRLKDGTQPRLCTILDPGFIHDGV